MYAALAVSWGLGCAPSSNSTAPTAPAAPLATASSGPGSSAETGFGDGFRRIEARGQGLTFPLPDPREYTPLPG